MPGIDQNNDLLSPEQVWTYLQRECPLLSRMFGHSYVEREANKDYAQSLDTTFPRQLAELPNDTTRGYLSKLERLLQVISDVPGFAKLRAGFRGFHAQAISTIHHVTTAAWLAKQHRLVALEKSVEGATVADCVVEVRSQQVFVECFAPDHRPSHVITAIDGVAAWMEHEDEEYWPRVNGIAAKLNRQLPSSSPGLLSLAPRSALGVSWASFAQAAMNPFPHVLGAIVWRQYPLTTVPGWPELLGAFPHWVRNRTAVGMSDLILWGDDGRI